MIRSWFCWLLGHGGPGLLVTAHCCDDHEPIEIGRLCRHCWAPIPNTTPDIERNH